LSQARRIADHMALLWVQNGSGKLVESGTMDQIFLHPREELTAAYVNGVRG
jgi:phosphate transport system ATP-binding protein